MFRQIIYKLIKVEIPPNDDKFISRFSNFEMRHWILPIIPQIYNHLDLSFDSKICCGLGGHDIKLYLDVYEYIFIRLSSENFDNYLSEK